MILNYSNSPVIAKDDCSSIFLAGPTPRSNDIKSWREEAIKILEQLKFDGIVYIPECNFSSETFDYNEQVSWEWEAMEEADIIAFWIPRSEELPGFTTNVEFGYWLHTGKVLYGRPDNAKKIKYLDWLYKVDTNMEPYNSIEDLLLSSISKANEVGISFENEMLPLQKRKLLK